MPPDSYVVQLANQGYAAFGLAYTGVLGVSAQFANIPLEYFQKAISWLKARKEVDKSRLALLGTSLGGVASLLIASHSPDIKAVIALGGGGELFQPFEGEHPQPLFTYQNKPLAFLRFERPLGLLSSFFSQSAEKVEEAAIKVEKINGPILLIAGLDDRLFGSAMLSSIAYNRLKANHFKHPYQLIIYNGVGHLNALSGLPFCPTTINALGIQPGGILCDLGGNPQDSAKAHIDAWRQLFEFLRRSL
jgi:dipeptidyl aminopeptidase/acylaminoacyl peptidase